MNSRTILTYSGAILTATMPIWLSIPGLSFLFELTMIGTIIYSVTERRGLYIIIASVIAIIISSASGLSDISVFYFLPILGKAVIPAFVFGVCLNRGMKAAMSFLVSAIALIVLTMVHYFETVQFYTELLNELFTSLSDSSKAYFAASGYSEEIINQFVDNMIKAKNLLIRMLPGFMVLLGLGELFIAVVLLEWYYKRRDSYFPGFGVFIYWKMPEKLLYVWAATLAVRLLTEGSVQMAADNMMMVLVFCYSLTGLALLEHLLRKLRLPMFIKVIFYLGLLFTQLPGLIITAIVGLLDSYFDFRKVRAHTLG